jgi:hypothetical protein
LPRICRAQLPQLPSPGIAPPPRRAQPVSAAPRRFLAPLTIVSYLGSALGRGFGFPIPGPEEELPAKLSRELESGSCLPDESGATEALREIRARTTQGVFRRIIRSLYEDRCCISGLDVPELNRASHIIPWSENAATRMDPRNGLLLAATYDAAFDRHLITFDDEYRMVVSREIRDHYSTASVRELFANREGQPISLPSRYLPAPAYLDAHRARVAV